MTPRSAHVPAYRFHRPSGQAVVTLSGRDFYLGPWDTESSRAQYDVKIAEWLAAGRQIPIAPAQLTVNHVILRYWEFAKRHYRKHGEPTQELDNIKYALRPLKRLYGTTLATSFGPLALKALRQHLIEQKLSRGVINSRIEKLKRVFRWAESEQLVHEGLNHSLSTVKGLQKGRCDAPDLPAVKPVTDEIVLVTIPCMPPVVAAMVRFQRLTGARPGEVCVLRPCDLTPDRDVWEYRPSSHKVEHLDRERVICVGPMAQAVLRPYLARAPEEYCFSPAESEAERKRTMRVARKTKVQPSQMNRANQAVQTEPRRGGINERLMNLSLKPGEPLRSPGSPTTTIMPTRIEFDQATVEFHFWTPGDGKVFDRIFAFDCETTAIDDARPWITPAYVLGAAYDGRRGVFISRDHLLEFLIGHDLVPMVMHNAHFDLAVINLVAVTLDIYRWVDWNRVWDTRLLHRLLMLAAEGHTARGKGESTLDTCVERYLGGTLPKDVVDAEGKPVRTSFDQWLNKPPDAIPENYLNYLGLDVVATYQLYHTLRRQLCDLLDHGEEHWGYIDGDWLLQQRRTLGPQTHHIQLKAEIVLNEITRHGLRINQVQRDAVSAALESVAAELLQELRSAGYLPGKGSQKALQSILARLERENPETYFPRTATGQYSTAEDTLSEIASAEPFVSAYLEYRGVEKLQTSFLAKMGRLVVHPSFDVLARTGRTTSFGEINAQNLPRDDRVRRCFAPKPGNVFIVLDFKTVEMATLAQSMQSQFEQDSRMAEAINRGEDLHTIVAAEVTGKRVEAVTKEERQKAKAINFGKPGGMGNATLTRYAKASYGVQLSEDEAAAMSEAWLRRFPEMVQFLNGSDGGLHVAATLGLTPADYSETTGEPWCVDHEVHAGREHEPSSMVGWMALKAYRDEEPCSGRGKRYSDARLQYFWSKLATIADQFLPELQDDIANERPSCELRRAVLNYAGRAGVFTFTGRLRANASYTARHNTVFQGLAADGAKLALWGVWRAGYQITNFIHDELVIEVSANSRLLHHAEIIKALMIEGMKTVVPDVRIDVDYVVTAAWSKEAVLVLDDQGRLRPWNPASEAA